MDALIRGSIALVFIYFAVVYIAAYVAKKLRRIQSPVIKKGGLLSLVKNSGIFVSLGGFYLFGFSYWGGILQPFGAAGGILLCFIGISLGVIGKISQDFYQAPPTNRPLKGEIEQRGESGGEETMTVDTDIEVDKHNEHLYLQANEEVKNNNVNETLWIKALTQAEGDESKAKFQYIKFRVRQLEIEEDKEKEQEKERISKIQASLKEKQAIRRKMNLFYKLYRISGGFCSFLGIFFAFFFIMCIFDKNDLDVTVLFGISSSLCIMAGILMFKKAEKIKTDWVKINEEI